jgi:hypothetical protein
MKRQLIRQFRKNTQISNFMKIRPVEAELVYAGVRTDLTIAFHKSANRLKSTKAEDSIQNRIKYEVKVGKQED